MKQNIMYIISIVLLLVSCQNADTKIINTEQSTTIVEDSALIIINKNSSSKYLNVPTQIFSTDYYGNQKLVLLCVASEQKKIHIPSSSILNIDLGMKSQSFIVEAGDIININLDKDTVLIKANDKSFITFKDFKNASNNFTSSIGKIIDSLYTKTYDKHYMNKDYFEYVKKKTISLPDYNKNGLALKENCYSQYLKEISLLDSLEESKIISSAYKKWITVLLKMEKIGKANVVDFFTDRNFKENFNRYDFINDTLLDIFFYDYKGYLSTTFLYGTILKYNRIKFPSGQSSYNFINGFDSADKYINNKSLDYIKFQCLTNIKEENSNSVFEIYKNKFYNSTKDTLLINYVKNNLDNSKQITLSKGDILKDINGNVFSINEIIRKGKILYVDFWASWCAPCRQEIPYSLELHEQYKSKNIDFIYISTDEDFAKWKNAVNQMQMQNFPHNYLLINQKESSIVTTQKINTIPRYLIYNKKGEIAYKEAPSPSNPEVKLIIDELLKQ